MNKPTLRIVQDLHPAILTPLLAALQEIDCALMGRAEVVFTSGGRTFNEQGGLYAKGRTVVNPDGRSAAKPMGNIVTNAEPGESIHNYFLAFDMALLIDGKLYKWDMLSDFDGDGLSDWMECVKIFIRHGFEWGGLWRTFPDPPHFQMDFGYSWQQLLVKHRNKEFIPGTTFIDLNRAVLDPDMYRTTASVNLRSGPSTSTSVLQVVIKGELVHRLTDEGAWSKVSYKGRIGYMSTQYITK